jgi:predicted O-linked N-acetylglucosamine transferase (SPINDLY family)
MKAMDYLLADPVIAPPGREAFYVEQVYRLPGGFSCFTPPPGAPAVNDLPAGDCQPVTLVSTHSLMKLNEQVLALWSRVLAAVPQSRLRFVRNTLSGETLDHLSSRVREAGMDLSRVEFISQMPPGGHLEIYHQADILLDVFPWSGHTTACEALWMGVPPVTLLGESHAGRMVASVLTQMGLTQLIAQTPDEYISIIAALAADRHRLADLRRTMRSRMQNSLAGNPHAFARQLETALRDMWMHKRMAMRCEK